ncbi:MAG TPA: hypothetical protein VGG46_02190 [Terriglobales bacterium]
MNENRIRREWHIKSLVLMCVLIVAFVGFVQAVHVHTDNSKVSTQDCTICSVAHSGVIQSVSVSPIPVFHRIVAALQLPKIFHQSSGYVFSLRIRPPPAV